MTKIKELLATIVYGFSTFSINPDTDYLKDISHTPNEISSKAWYTTGNNLKRAISKVGE